MTLNEQPGLGLSTIYALQDTTVVCRVVRFQISIVVLYVCMCVCMCLFMIACSYWLCDVEYNLYTVSCVFVCVCTCVYVCGCMCVGVVSVCLCVCGGGVGVCVCVCVCVCGIASREFPIHISTCKFIGYIPDCHIFTKLVRISVLHMYIDIHMHTNVCTYTQK